MEEDNPCLPNPICFLILFQIVVAAILLSSLVSQYMTDKVMGNHEKRIRLVEQLTGNF
jgi:hypothetical protein